MIKRIYLIGLPGAGKSTIGEFIANELNWKFIDLDAQIEEAEGKEISEIFEQEGEEYFRAIERNELRALISRKVVISAGGGTPCYHSNMDWINGNGFSIFLNPPKEVLIERLKNTTHRPLIGEDAGLTIKRLFQERIHFYRQVKMESSHTDPCEIMAELRKFL